MSFPGTRKELEDYLAQSRQRHIHLFHSSTPGSLVFSNNHILYKTAELHGDAPPDQQKKTCLDLPYDIGLCVEHARKHPHFHGFIITKNNFWRQFHISIIDVPITVNVDNRGQANLALGVICVVVNDNGTGLQWSLYVHTVHFRKTETKLLKDSLGQYVPFGDPQIWHNHRNLFRGPEPSPFLRCLYKLYPDTYTSILKEPWKKWREYTYCLHPNCGKCNTSGVTLPTQPLWHFQSTVQLHQPQVYSSPPLLYQTTSVSQSTSTISTSTSQNNTPPPATGNSIPSHNTPQHAQQIPIQPLSQHPTKYPAILIPPLPQHPTTPPAILIPLQLALLMVLFLLGNVRISYV